MEAQAIDQKHTHDTDAFNNKIQREMESKAPAKSTERRVSSSFANLPEICLTDNVTESFS